MIANTAHVKVQVTQINDEMHIFVLPAGSSEPTSCIADVQVHHIFLVQEEGAEVDTAGSQHGFVGLEVHPVHHKGAVTQQALFALAV